MARLSEYLEQVADRLASGWCKDYLAMDANGKDVSPDDPEAVAWCAAGAVCRVAGENDGLYEWLIDWINERLPRGWQHVSAYNDYEKTRKQDVLRLVKEAAADALRAEGWTLADVKPENVSTPNFSKSPTSNVALVES